MTEEEKKAIERLKHFNDGFTFKDCDVCDNYNEKDSCCNKEKCDELKAVDTALNLIQKQQAELEKKDKESHFIQSELDIANAKIIELNKIIDEMAEKLEKAKLAYFKKEDGGEFMGKYRTYNKNDWKQYFINKVNSLEQQEVEDK